MQIKLLEDNYIQSDNNESMLISFLRAAFTYKGAALSIENVQDRIDSGIKLENYKYDIVDGQVVSKDGSANFFIKDPDWSSPVFNTETGAIKWGDQEINPYSDHSLLPQDIATFCQAIWDNGGKTLYDAIQAEQEALNND